jgi:hypothetical protein
MHEPTIAVLTIPSFAVSLAGNQDLRAVALVSGRSQMLCCGEEYDLESVTVFRRILQLCMGTDAMVLLRM